MADRRATVLVVDDAPSNIQTLFGVLREHYKVQAATRGAQALELARHKHPPDLILLDIEMPEMNGYELCRQLKADGSTSAIPVIFITAMDEEIDETRGFEMGAVDYITKPVRPAVLLARVRTHLKIRQMQAQLERQNEALVEASKLRDDVEHITRHDLKGPLNPIIGVSNALLAGEECSDQAKRMLRLVERAGHSMLGMINRSLDLYKMEIGSYHPSLKATNVMPALWSALREASEAPAAAGKLWKIRSGGLPMDESEEVIANAEEMLCYSMFSNLLQNAFEASPSGETVEIDIDDRDPRMVQIAINNVGAVPEAIRERFFDKYVTFGKKTGTGLGTYSAKLCAETQQGSIALDWSHEGRSKVVITLLK